MDLNTTTASADTSLPAMLTIGALSRATSIPVPTLRTWERRYGQPRPERRPSGHRLYPLDFVARLRQVESLLRYGHRAETLLSMSLSDLEALATLMAQREAALSQPLTVAHAADLAGRTRESLMRSVIAMDREALLTELRLNWARLGPLRSLHECLGPLMAEVGMAWRERRIEVRHEHFATSTVSTFLHELRQPYDRVASGPVVVASTMPHDPHEGGIQMASLVLSMRGFRVTYLGADTPLEEISGTVRQVKPAAVAVSLSAILQGLRGSNLLAHLRELVPPQVPLWAGGAGVPHAVEGVDCFADLPAFDSHVVRWLEKRG